MDSDAQRSATYSAVERTPHQRRLLRPLCSEGAWFWLPHSLSPTQHALARTSHPNLDVLDDEFNALTDPKRSFGYQPLLLLLLLVPRLLPPTPPHLARGFGSGTPTRR